MNTLNAKDLKAIFTAMAVSFQENKSWLTELDGVIGDGDLGLTMSKGFTQIAENLERLDETDVGKVFGKAGMVMAKAVPSTMGTLMATGMMKGGKVLQGKTEIGLSDFAAMMQAFVEGIMARGKAKIGDKTVIDVLHPAALALKEAAEGGNNLPDGLKAAYKAAEGGLEETKKLMSQHGKAACFQEQTIGKQDPGATVGVLFLKAFADYVS